MFKNIDKTTMNILQVDFYHWAVGSTGAAGVKHFAQGHLGTT